MNYLLDTNICIHFFRGKFNLIEKFQEVKLENCAISEITLAELTFGAENSLNPKNNYTLINEFTEQGENIADFRFNKYLRKRKSQIEKKRDYDK